MLSCLNLALKLNNKNIFNEVSFSLLPGSIYILKGPNGSGKTTLLKTIAGLIDNNMDNIFWNNKKIDYEEYYRDIVGYLGHENAIKNDLSVIDNLALWASLKDTYLLIEPSMAHFKLTNIAGEKCKLLSSGWKKRVALARMIVGNTKLWLLDEPEANLDEEGKELLLKLLQVKIASGGIAIIASHDSTCYNKIPVINISDFKNDC